MKLGYPLVSVCPLCGDSTPARLRERAYGLDGDCRTTAISSLPWGELCFRRQLAAAKAMNAEWEQKAANWMASPEAQRQLDGYRELSMGQLAAIERAEKAESLLAKYQDMLRELEKENERLLLVAKYSDRVLGIMQHELKGEN